MQQELEKLRNTAKHQLEDFERTIKQLREERLIEKDVQNKIALQHEKEIEDLKMQTKCEKASNYRSVDSGFRIQLEQLIAAKDHVVEELNKVSKQLQKSKVREHELSTALSEADAAKKQLQLEVEQLTNDKDKFTSNDCKPRNEDYFIGICSNRFKNSNASIS
jgi:hypothetical protein